MTRTAYTGWRLSPWQWTATILIWIAVLIITAWLSGCACIQFPTEYGTASYTSLFHDFSAKKFTVTVNTNGFPQFTIENMNDATSPQVAAIVQGAVQGAIAGLK